MLITSHVLMAEFTKQCLRKKSLLSSSVTWVLWTIFPADVNWSSFANVSNALLRVYNSVCRDTMSTQGALI